MSDSSSSNQFRDKILRREPGIIAFGLTPPRITTDAERLQILEKATIERLSSMPIDAAIIYDIHDEADRNTEGVERPFAFVETIDGATWMNEKILPNVPKSVSLITYRCIQKHQADQLSSHCESSKTNTRSGGVVYVGAASSSSTPSISLSECYDLHTKITGVDPSCFYPTSSSSPTITATTATAASASSTTEEKKEQEKEKATTNSFTKEEKPSSPSNNDKEYVMGAVAIPERHAKKGDEHKRMIFKQKQGCRFFCTQCVYSSEMTKTMLSDYYYACQEEGLPVLPILLTFAPIGGMTTLKFLKYLGVGCSKWIENDLKHAVSEGTVLDESLDQLTAIMTDLCHFARRKQIPLGLNIESVAIRKVEIEAAVDLVTKGKEILEKELVF